MAIASASSAKLRPPGIPKGRRSSSWIRTSTSGVLSLAGFVILWQLVTMSGLINTKLFPSPVMVGEAAVSMWNSGVLLTDAAASLRRALIGYLIGAFLGVLLGLLTGRIRIVREMLNPVLTVLRPIPAIALVPVAIVWFGIGDDSKFFVIAYAVTLAVWLNTHAGASGVPQTYIRAAASLGTRRVRTFTHVIVPAAVPFIFTGLRLGATVAFLSLVAAELTGASTGIGYRLQEARQFLATDRMFVGLIELGILGAILDLALVWIGGRLVHWEAK